MMPTHPAPTATPSRPALVLGDEEIEVMPGVYLSKPTRSTANQPNAASTNPDPPAQQHWTDAYAAALNELPSDTLVAEFKALANSRDHLVRSNQELGEFAQEESEPAERQQLLDIVKENVALLPTFNIKQTLVASMLQKRGVDFEHSLGIKLAHQCSSVPAAATASATQGSEPLPQEGASAQGAVAERVFEQDEQGQGEEAEAEEGVFL